MKWFYLKPLSGSIYILTSIRAEKSWKLLIKLGLKLLVDQGGGGGGALVKNFFNKKFS